MACEIEKAIEWAKVNASSVYTKEINAILNDTDLGSDEYVNGDMVYDRYKQRIQDTADYWKTQIGKTDPTNKQTVKAVIVDNGAVIVSYNKGADVRKQPTGSLGSEEADTLQAKAESLRINGLTKDGMRNIIEELYDGNAGYKKYALGLINQIDEDFMPELKLYLNKEAERNAGVVTSDGNVIVDVASNMDKSDKSATEVYMHEIIHAITKFAIDSGKLEVFPIVNELEHLRDEAAKIFTYKDFMPEKYLDKAEAEKAAKARYEYIFKQPKSLHEFIAYGMTNPKVMNKLKRNKSKRPSQKGSSLFRWLSDKVNALLDVVLGKVKWGNIDKSMKAQLQQLTFELMKHNNEAVREVEKKSVSSIGKGLDISNEVLAGVLDKAFKYLEGKPGEIPTPPRNGTLVENTLYTLRFLPKLLLRKDLKAIRNQALSALGMKPEGTVQNVLRDVEDPDALERQIEQLISDSNTIDRVRELTVDVVRSEVQSKFNRKLDKVEEEAITLSAIDTDLSSIYKEYGSKKIVELLRNPEALSKKISTVKTQLKKLDEKNWNWNKNQSHGLGYYMATGKSGYAQNLNAYNISSGILSSNRRRADKSIMAKIDELATLTAIQYTPEASNGILSDLIAEQKLGIDYIMDLHSGSKKEARAKIFENDVNTIKGYSKELFDSTIDVKVKPLKYSEQMKMAGYELVERLAKDPADPTKEHMGLYRSKLYTNSSYNRAATRMTDMVKRGTGLRDVGYMEEEVISRKVMNRRIRDVKVRADEEAAMMETDNYTFNPEQSLSPVLSQDGHVTDYRYMMGKKRKKELLNQDTTVSQVLGRTIASIRDKVDTDLQNKAILEVILGDMDKNYVKGTSTGKNNHSYLKIENNSSNKEISEIYKLLPEHMKQAIKESNDGYIAVRRDMLHNYFGFRDKSIVDFFGIHHITPAVIQKWIRVAEKLWMEIVSISKVDIVIRTPAVFIGNVISNFMYSVVNGTPPWRVAKMQIRNMQAITTYLNKQRDIEKLRLAKMAGNKDAQKRIDMLQVELSRNPVHDLMEAGMYQAIVEDLSKQDYKSSNKLAQKLNESTENVPEFMRDGVNWLYLNENTSYFKIMTQATQYSDFVARATEYQLLQERGVGKQEALNSVLDAFVNYSKPASSLEEYLNNMGMFMFTKYMKRIQRAVRTSARTKPVNILLSILGQEAFYEVDDIQDQNIFTRSYANLDQEFFGHLRRMYAPTSLQFAGIISD